MVDTKDRHRICDRPPFLLLKIHSFPSPHVFQVSLSHSLLLIEDGRMGTMVDPLPLSDSVLGPAGFHKHAWDIMGIYLYWMSFRTACDGQNLTSLDVAIPKYQQRCPSEFWKAALACFHTFSIQKAVIWPMMNRCNPLAGANLQKNPLCVGCLGTWGTLQPTRWLLASVRIFWHEPLYNRYDIL